MIVTIQGPKEKPEDIIKECKRMKLKHYNFPLVDVSEDTMTNNTICETIRNHV